MPFARDRRRPLFFHCLLYPGFCKRFTVLGGSLSISGPMHVHEIVVTSGELTTISLGFRSDPRPHLSLERNSPVPRSVQPPAKGKVVAKAYLGGLHHLLHKGGVASLRKYCGASTGEEPCAVPGIRPSPAARRHAEPFRPPLGIVAGLTIKPARPRLPDR